jgi:hypothetical protein
MRWVRVFVTTNAPAFANACSIGPAMSASNAENTMRPGSGGVQSRTIIPAIPGGSSTGSRHRAASS